MKFFGSPSLNNAPEGFQNVNTISNADLFNRCIMKQVFSKIIRN